MREVEKAKVDGRTTNLLDQPGNEEARLLNPAG